MHCFPYGDKLVSFSSFETHVVQKKWKPVTAAVN